MIKLFQSLKLKYKFFLIFAINNILIIGCMWQVYLWSFDQGFSNYIYQEDQSYLGQMATNAKHLYRTYEDWDFLVTERTMEKQWHKRQLISDTNIPRPATPNLDLIYPSKNYRARFLFYDKDEKVLIGNVAFDNAITRPIILDDELIGYVGLRPINQILQGHTSNFVKQQGEAFLHISAFMLIITALIIWWLAKLLSSPICEMIQTTKRLTLGDYSPRLKNKSNDELGKLAFDLNHLAYTLENARESRKRWVADTAHELRTPLAILRGEIEAMQDGIIPITPESLESLLNETVHLGRLIDDLNQLSMHDTGSMDYKMERFDIMQVLHHSISTMQRTFDDADLLLKLEASKMKGINITADEDRLNQVFSNLMNNSLKYTHSPGELVIKVNETANEVVIQFEDSSPGIGEDEINQVFDRFFRVETSRNRAEGGRGLGLSICRSIVAGHRGEISAYHSPNKGLGIKIVLPKK